MSECLGIPVQSWLPPLFGPIASPIVQATPYPRVPLAKGLNVGTQQVQSHRADPKIAAQDFQDKEVNPLRRPANYRGVFSTLPDLATD